MKLPNELNLRIKRLVESDLYQWPKIWEASISYSQTRGYRLYYIIVCFVYFKDFQDIGRIEHVFLKNVHRELPLEWIEIRPDKSPATLLTEIEQRGDIIMMMKGLKYRIFTTTGNKLRKDDVKVSIQLIVTDT